MPETKQKSKRLISGTLVFTRGVNDSMSQPGSDCGEAMPVRNMHEKYDDKPKKRGEQTLVCPKCLEARRAAWRMDKEKSFARMEITPVRSADGLAYHLSYAIKIEPYPNPYSYGGMYGGGAAETKEGLDIEIAKFNAQADSLRQNGMEKVEVITHEETVRAEQRKLEAKPPKAPRGTVQQSAVEPDETKQLQLSLI